MESGEQEDNFLGFHLGSDGGGAHHVYRTGLSHKVNGIELMNSGKLVQNGREVFRWAVRTVPKASSRCLKMRGQSLRKWTG